MNAKALLDHAIKSGAALIAVHRIPLFREFARSSLHRLVRTGKLPCVKMGRSYYTTPDIAATALAEGSQIKSPPGLEHSQAVENLARKGLGTIGRKAQA